MRNLWLVTKREYMGRIKSGAYITSSLLLVVMFFAATLLPPILSSRSRSQPLRVSVLDQTGQIYAPLEATIKAAPRAEGAREVVLTQAQGDESTLMERVESGDFALLTIEGTFPSDLKARYLSRNMGGLTDSGAVLAPLEGIVRKARMEQRGLSPEVALEIMRPLQVETRQVTGGGERDQNQVMGNFLLAFGAIMSIYMITMINSQFVFQGVLEEKVSRVVEVMAAAVRPAEMMAGKVLGLGALGLTQYAAMMVAWAAGNAVAKSVADVPAQNLTFPVALLIAVFILLSYLLNSSIMAALGATVSRMEDSQTVMTPVVMLMVIPMFLITPVMNDPNGSLAVALSFVPFFAPIIMLLRVIVGDVPTWQVWLSVGILAGTAALVTWASGRIYRAALLTFGSRPTMKQIWQYLKAG